MNYTLPSLEHLALIKTVDLLISTHNNKTLIYRTANDFYSNDEGEDKIDYEILEEELIEKLAEISVPKSLKEKLLCLIKPVSLEILAWIKYNFSKCDLGEIMPSTFHWTSQGMVNYRKTAELLIEDENLHVKKRYILACIYCLEEEIPKLWNQLSVKDRKIVNRRKGPKNCQQFLVFHWTQKMMNNLRLRDNSNYKLLLKKSVKNGNEEATKYFFQKITPAERNNCLVGLVKIVSHFKIRHCCNLLCFLLSKLNKEQEIEVMRTCGFHVLLCFLRWPLQSQFMEMANRMWDYFGGLESPAVITLMVKVTASYKDYNYQNLLGEFWQQMPASHKRLVILLNIYSLENVNGEHNLLIELLKIGYHKNFHIIMEEANAEECLAIFSVEGDKDKVYSQSVILQVVESSSSKDVVQFVKEFKEHIMRTRPKEDVEDEEGTWNTLFQKFNDILRRNKRSIEECENGPVKRRHIVEN